KYKGLYCSLFLVVKQSIPTDLNNYLGRPTCCFPYVSLFLSSTSQDRHWKLTFYLSLWVPLALLPFGWNSLGMFDASPLGMNGGDVSGPLLLSVFFLLLPAALSSWGIFALLLSDFMSITFSVCL